MVQKIGLVSKDIVMTGGGGVTDHGALTGLTDDDHTQYVKHSLATAANDFLVASGVGVFIKKTLAEVIALITNLGTLGIKNPPIDADKFVFRDSTASDALVTVTGAQLKTYIGAGGSVATDTIWDAKGDLAVGTGADTASKLAVGANWKVPMAASGEATGLFYKYPIELGSTFPASPYTGMLFTHAVTGRTILYEYSGAAWIPLYSIGAMTLYVDNTDGTDTLESKGTGVDAAAFKTVQFAVDCIPPVYTGNVVININAETYAETVTVGGKNPSGPYTITIQGTLSASDNLISSGAGGAGVTSTKAYWTDTGLSANAYNNKLFKFTSGTNNGTYRVIDTNTTTQINFCGMVLPAAPANLDTGTVYNWGTTITALIISPGQKDVYLYDIYINSGAAQSIAKWYLSTAYFTRCKFAGSGYWSGVIYGNTTFTNCLVINTSCGFYTIDYCYIQGTKFVGYTIEAIHIELGGKAYMGGGNVFDGVTAAAQTACIASTNGTLIFWSSDVYNFIRNNQYGVKVFTGAQGAYTAYNSYATNTADENAAAASYSYID